MSCKPRLGVEKERCGGKKERRKESRWPRRRWRKNRPREGGVDKEGRHCHARVFHRLFHPRSIFLSLPVSLSLSLSFQAPPRSVHTLPRVATSRLHPLAPTERENGSGGGGGGGGDGGGSVFLITTAIFFSSRDDAAAKRYRNISPPINPVVTSFGILDLHPYRVSIVGMWDSIGRTRSRDARVGWTGVIARFISLSIFYEIAPLWLVKSLEVFRGGWAMSVFLVWWPGPECRKVATAYIRIYTRIRRGGARKATYACLVWDCEIVGWATTRYCSLFQRVRLELWLVSRERDTRARRWQCIVWSIINGHARVLIRFVLTRTRRDFVHLRGDTM